MLPRPLPLLALLWGCQASLTQLDSTVSSETLVLLVEPPSSPNALGAWRIYDPWGALRIDLAQHVDLDAADYERIYLGVPMRGAPSQGRTFQIKDEAPEGYAHLMPSQRFVGTPGVQSDLQVLVWADGRAPTEPQRLIGLSVRGERLLDMTLEQRCSNFVLSFSGRYIFGQLRASGRPLDDRGLVIDVRSQTIVWTGAMRSGVFLHDDSGFLVLAPGERDQVVLIELPSGASRALPSPSATVPEHAQTGLGTYLGARAATSRGTIFRNYGNITSGQFLWWLTPEARWLPVGGAPQLHAKETLIGAVKGALIFERGAISGQRTTAQLGVLRFDQRTETHHHLGETLHWLGEDRLYVKEGEQMYAATFDGDRAPFGPALDAFSAPAPWRLDFCTGSYQGGVMVVCAKPDRSGTGPIPPEPPEEHPEAGTWVYRDLQPVGPSLPAGTSRLDEAGRVLVLKPSAPERTNQIAIMDLQSEEVRWIETAAQRVAFLYPVER